MQIANWQVASRYAKALLQLAIEQNSLNQAHEDMMLLKKYHTESNGQLLAMLSNPIMASQQKWGTLQKLIADQVSELTLRFLKLVIQKKREAMLFEILDAFFNQYNQHKGIQTAHITTTFALSDDLLPHFEQLVQSIAPCKQVRFIQHIQPDLLGGFILQVADKRLDKSLKNKLYALKKQCITSGY